MHDELANGDLAGLLQRIADNGIAFVGLVAIRQAVEEWFGTGAARLALEAVTVEGTVFPEWQPISTAPKDGTSILIFEAHWGTEGIVRVSRWRDDTIPSGWTGVENAPSHWLPLPVPPNRANGKIAKLPLPSE
jgi:hypothetical protein